MEIPYTYIMLNRSNQTKIIQVDALESNLLQTFLKILFLSSSLQFSVCIIKYYQKEVSHFVAPNNPVNPQSTEGQMNC
jgi:hypothetical protein